jgi:hypothetical protein
MTDYGTPKTPTAGEVAEALELAQAYSDQDPACLARLAELFVAAHLAAPGGISIELGTRKGGSALLFLQLLLRMYPELQPMLVTVDPYGLKPYNGGDCVIKNGLYGDEEYLAAKSILRGYPNHAHFLTDSQSFLSRCLRLRLYRNGLPGELADASFIFHDGDHSADGICGDLGTILLGLSLPTRQAAWLQRKGTVVIDNVHADSATVPILRSYSGVQIEKQFAVVRGDAFSVT